VAGTPPVIHLTKPVGERVRLGHPWVFRDALRLPAGLAAGQVVDLLDEAGHFVARGTAEPDSALTFRAWTLDRDTAIDGGLVRWRLARAAELRKVVVAEAVTGYRACHGECDDVPGLHVDCYDGIASLRLDGEVGVVWEDRFTWAVRSVLAPRAIVVRSPRLEEGTARCVEGVVDGPVVIAEGSRRFLVDVMHGQKTGFFLDQRDNRDRVAALAAGRRVLNLFSYTGGFSVAAALAGAREVVSVDSAGPAIAMARENFALNDIAPAGHGFVTADAFEVLANEAAKPGRFDLIVVDPPAFAPSQKTLPRALKAYQKLNAMALGALSSGSWLATASCSGHLRREAFLEMLSRAAWAAQRTVRLAGIYGAAPDHPGRLGFPEGEYLKFALLYVV
jgi:23S rRNA (cytosine1962-C5)-methyltransferase